MKEHIEKMELKRKEISENILKIQRFLYSWKNDKSPLKIREMLYEAGCISNILENTEKCLNELSSDILNLKNNVHGV